MSQKFHKILIVSGLIPATVLFILILVAFGAQFSNPLSINSMYSFLVITIGIIGYFGFLRLLYIGLNHKLLTTIIFLTFGVFCSIALIGFIDFLNKYLFKSELLGNLIFAWPNLVALFYIILLSLKLIEKRKEIV